MKKNLLAMLILMLVIVMSISGCVSEPTDTDDTPGTEIGEGTDDTLGETGDSDEPEIIIDSVPTFCGNWICNYQGTDGNRWVLFVDLLEDGTASYRCGPPESEIMVDCQGTWKLNEEDHILLDLVDTYEGFPFKGEYNWEVEGGTLSISSIIGDAFIYDTEGVTFVFGAN